MSATPRTDKQAFDWSEDCTPAEDEIVLASFARELERENADLADALEGVLHILNYSDTTYPVQQGWWSHEQEKKARTLIAGARGEIEHPRSVVQQQACSATACSALELAIQALARKRPMPHLELEIAVILSTDSVAEMADNLEYIACRLRENGWTAGGGGGGHSLVVWEMFRKPNNEMMDSHRKTNNPEA